MKDGLYMGDANWFLVKGGVITDEGSEVFPDKESTITIEKDEKGRKKKWTEIIVDVRTDKVIQTREENHTYYPTDEIDEIDQKTKDKNGKIKSHNKIKHFKDGRKPKVKKIK